MDTVFMNSENNKKITKVNFLYKHGMRNLTYQIVYIQYQISTTTVSTKN